MRVLTTAAAATFLTLAVGSPALGHAELVPWQLPPGANAGMLLLVTHGCGDEDEWLSSEPMPEEPTVAVTIQAPLELEIDPGELAGWTLTTDTDATGRVVSARWDIDDPAGTADTVQLPFDVVVGDVPDGSEIWLPVVQECTGGDSLSWTLEGDLRGGDEVPAMRLVINDDATIPAVHDGSSADGPPQASADRDAVAAAEPTLVDRFGWPSLLVGIAGLAAVATVLVRRRGVTATS